MRFLVPVAAALSMAACSGASEQTSETPPPTEQAAAESTPSEAPAAETPAPEEAPAKEEVDLAAVEDLNTLFTVSANVDKAQVAGIIGQRKPDIYDCYSKALEKSPGLAGRVLMKITATSSGDVASAIVQKSTIQNAALQQCMTTRIRKWKLPNDNSGGLIVVQYAFQLPP